LNINIISWRVKFLAIEFNKKALEELSFQCSARNLRNLKAANNLKELHP
jgi:hypothetical protein